MKEETIPVLASFGKVGRFLLLLGIILGAVSCSVEKKNAKAVDRVLASRQLLDTVGKRWAELNPCEDPKPEIIPGKTDTVTKTVTDDTKAAALARKVDSLLSLPGTNVDSLKKAIREQILKECSSTHTTTNTTRVDTSLQVNYRALQMEKEAHSKTWLKYVKENELRIAAQQGEIKAKDKADGYRKQRNTLRWILAAIAVLTGIFAYFKLKSKPLKAIINSGDIHKN